MAKFRKGQKVKLKDGQVGTIHDRYDAPAGVEGYIVELPSRFATPDLYFKLASDLVRAA